MADPTRIPLRHYRLFTRAPYLQVDGNEISVRLPGAFGGEARWRIPVAEIGVVEPRHQRGVPVDRGDGSVFVEPPRIPYIPTTSPNVRPTLELLFRRPIRIPPVRAAGAFNTRLPYRASRTPAGYALDGVSLRARDPKTAFEMLVAAGAEPLIAPGLWLAEHRETTTDPVQVGRIVRDQRRARVLLRITLAVFAVCVVASRILEHTGHEAASLVPLGIALVVVFAPAALRLRPGRRPHKHEPPVGPARQDHRA